MSYDLSLWDGPKPRSAEHASELVDVWAEAEENIGPASNLPGGSTRLPAMLAELFAAVPDRDVTGNPNHPAVWAAGYLPDEGKNGYTELNILSQHAERVVPLVDLLARKHGIMVYNPQDDDLLGAARPRKPWWKFW